MEALIDFLSFRTLISPSLLIFFYYLGAVGIPLLSWYLARWLVRRFPSFAQALSAGVEQVHHLVEARARMGLWLVAIIGFIFMEILWRMMFEFLIVYFQIRDALVGTI